MLAGTTAGFLVFNWHPAKIFLGESGSLWCGFMLGVLSIISGSKVATTLLVMGIPMLDVVWVIIRRLRHRQGIATADRLHIHHRLLAAGLSQRQVALVLYFFTAAFGMTSLFLHTKGKVIALILICGIMLLLAWLLIHIKKRKQVLAS
jgi:UDP-GlcNAc:undecaprenyl-phosphate GlcNAc-1-phosphate transferase